MNMEKLHNLGKMKTAISFFFSVRFNSVFVSFSLLLNKYLEKENFFFAYFLVNVLYVKVTRVS